MFRHGLIELEAVLAIARRGSFRAATLELGVSTTALSNAIGKLERQLGVRLFNRTTRSVSLTDAARASACGCTGGALYRWQFEKDGQTVQIDVRGAITLDEASLARIAAWCSF